MRPPRASSSGLNVTPDELADPVAQALARGTGVLLAPISHPPAGRVDLWRQAADTGARPGVDAVIVADMGVAGCIARTHPQLRLHLAVQAAASPPKRPGGPAKAAA